MTFYGRLQGMKDWKKGNAGPAWRLSDAKLVIRKEVERILAWIKQRDPDGYLLIVVSANSGLRISEVLHLRTKDVLQSTHGILVTRRKKKTFHEETLPLAPSIHALLVARAAELRSGWLWPGQAGKCVVVRRRSGKAVAREGICQGGHLHKRSAQRIWEEANDALKIRRPLRGIHSLRHYAITEFYRTNRDLRAAQVYAGHSSSAVTEVYAHVVDLEEQVHKIKPVL